MKRNLQVRSKVEMSSQFLMYTVYTTDTAQTHGDTADRPTDRHIYMSEK